MEFFNNINKKISQTEIQENINFENLENICENIFIENTTGNIATIGCIWGEFSLQKDLINGGLRFSLLECPNALTFTITTGHPPALEQVVFHLTINRKTISEEFIEEIEEFIQDWKIGIEKYFSSSKLLKQI